MAPSLRKLVETYNAQKKVLDTLEDSFNLKAPKCPYYEKEEHDPSCTHADGDGFCAINLCPLDRTG